MMADRKARLERERQEKDEAEKQARKAVAKARREEAEQAAGASSSVPPSRQSYLEEQRTRQREAKLDKERVLKAIESDKQARRERERQRRLAAQGEDASGVDSQEGPSNAAQPSASGLRAQASRTPQTHCALQIRLFDGTSIRSRFSVDSTLSTAVRTYISENSQTDIPYNFRAMLNPLPSRNIEISEENESLQSLGLCPSATLVLVPVKDFTDAYYVSGGTGIINKGINTTFHLINGVYGYASGILGRITGYGGDGASDGPYVAGTGDEVEPSNVQGSKMAEGKSPAGPSSGIKIRTLADQRRDQEGTELYNGNQVSQSSTQNCTSWVLILLFCRSTSSLGKRTMTKRIRPDDHCPVAMPILTTQQLNTGTLDCPRCESDSASVPATSHWIACKTFLNHRVGIYAL